MDYEYEQDDDFAGRILWGRVAVYGVSLLFAFALGYCVSPSGVPQSDFDDEQARVSALAEENERLRQDIEALSAQPDVPTDPAPNGEGEPPPDAGPSYEVASGDTLNSIAQSRCGSTEFAPQIAELNGIDAANRLQVGQVLQLPPECTS